MAQPCSWPRPVAPFKSDPTSFGFSVGGVIVGVRDTTPADPAHPAVMLVVDCGDFCRIAVPPDVWPAPRDLLAIGQYVGVSGTTDSSPLLQGSRSVATEVRLVGTYH
jgi:hypothetical protein